MHILINKINMQNNFKYIKQVPNNASKNSKVIIMLHWVRSNADNMFNLSEYFENDYVFSLNWLYDLWSNSYAWYNMSYINWRTPVYNWAEVEIWYQYIVDFIEYVKNQYELWDREIYLLWFSQWSNMSYYLYGKSPELISWIIALSGRFLKETAALNINKELYNNKKVFIWHGTSDDVIPVSVVGDLEVYINKSSVNPVIKIYDNMPHTIIPEEMMEVVKFLSK